MAKNKSASSKSTGDDSTDDSTQEASAEKAVKLEGSPFIDSDGSDSEPLELTPEQIKLASSSPDDPFDFDTDDASTEDASGDADAESPEASEPAEREQPPEPESEEPESEEPESEEPESEEPESEEPESDTDDSDNWVTPDVAALAASYGISPEHLGELSGLQELQRLTRIIDAPYQQTPYQQNGQQFPQSGQPQPGQPQQYAQTPEQEFAQNTPPQNTPPQNTPPQPQSQANGPFAQFAQVPQQAAPQDPQQQFDPQQANSQQSQPSQLSDEHRQYFDSNGLLDLTKFQDPEEFDSSAYALASALRATQELAAQSHRNSSYLADRIVQEEQSRYLNSFHDQLDEYDPEFFGKSIDDKGDPVDVPQEQYERRAKVFEAMETIREISRKQQVSRGLPPSEPPMAVVVKRASDLVFADEINQAKGKANMQKLSNQSRKRRRVQGQSTGPVPIVPSDTPEEILKSPALQEFLRDAHAESGY